MENEIIKIHKYDLKVFEILSKYTTLTVEDTIQKAFEIFLNTASSSIEEQKKLMALSVESKVEFEKVEIKLTKKQKKTLKLILSNRSQHETYSKLFDLYIGYLSLPNDIQQRVDSALRESNGN